MNSDRGLKRFAEDLRQEVIARSQREGGESLRTDAFTELLIEYLTDAGELEDGHVAHYAARGMEITGYSVSDDETRLDLLAAIHRQRVPPETVQRVDVDAAFTRLIAFFNRARGDLPLSMEESDEAFDMALRIHELEKLEKVCLFVITDGLTTAREKPAEDRSGVSFSYNVWDIRRIQRCVTSGQQQEAIHIDFVERFGRPLDCLVAPQEWSDYAAYLAIIPGTVLEQIYDEYGARLLERNVRAFLQVRGKVNQGIRRTILNEPERFLAYNNGISATASSVRVVPVPGGGTGIAEIQDLQVVNGGQTTASIHHVARRDRADISHIHVQAKITVVDTDQLSEIVPLISRYANSQNKVNEADFEANDPFHVAIEKLSRTVWAPASGASQEQTHWFYERARGQYHDALGRTGTPARQRHFKAENPQQQRFTKTDLAKFEHSWSQLPHLVSLGAEKNFRHFTLNLNARSTLQPTQEYFERLIARAILFRRTEKIVSQQPFQGYRANIVTYTIAYLAKATAQQLNLDRIWMTQEVPAPVAEFIDQASREVRNALVDAPGSGNVTEWCKKPACWERVRNLQIPLPTSLRNELVDAVVSDSWRASAAILAALGATDRPLGRSELLERTGISESAWSPTIRTLVESGQIFRQGDRRGAVYVLAR